MQGKRPAAVLLLWSQVQCISKPHSILHLKTSLKNLGPELGRGVGKGTVIRGGGWQKDLLKDGSKVVLARVIMRTLSLKGEVA